MVVLQVSSLVYINIIRQFNGVEQQKFINIQLSMNPIALFCIRVQGLLLRQSISQSYSSQTHPRKPWYKVYRGTLA